MKYVALGDVTIHKLLQPELDKDKDNPMDLHVKSVILSAGDYLDETEVPFYVKDEHKAGRLPLLSLVNNNKAKELEKEAERARELSMNSIPPPVIIEGDAESSGPGRLSDVPSGITEIDGETVIVSGDNSGYGQDSQVQHETITIA